MPETTGFSQRTIRALLGLVVLGLAGAAIILNLPSGPSGPLGGQPMPTLFAKARLGLIDRLATAPKARADIAFSRWVRAHPARDDAGFSRYVLATVGGPPSGAVQHDELLALHRIDAARTPAGVAAATWLEAHGKKDVWKLFDKQYGAFVAKPEAKQSAAVFKATYKLGNLLAAQGKAHFGRPSPYIADPSLHALNQQRFVKKFSYPAKHAVLSFALSSVLSHYEPERAGEYRWMTDEVAFSRLYAGGHYPSDIVAGAYIGTLVALYELHFASTT
ncbi:phosphatase PAP2 family protein [Baekduia soli]|uniref:Phosphatase PAP2 family protein n=1 Tax=Baekduia soli TaxID=496014 RepID=A0A5B8U6Q8_9ACTN|nr:phosphatase PAP2 family protein [Baekduia soli]QEC48776.1 phosphatase PAP2 family protein [Baekduia soli]